MGIQNFPLINIKKQKLKIFKKTQKMQYVNSSTRIAFFFII